MADFVNHTTKKLEIIFQYYNSTTKESIYKRSVELVVDGNLYESPYSPEYEVLYSYDENSPINGYKYVGGLLIEPNQTINFVIKQTINGVECFGNIVSKTYTTKGLSNNEYHIDSKYDQTYNKIFIMSGADKLSVNEYDGTININFNGAVICHSSGDISMPIYQSVTIPKNFCAYFSLSTNNDIIDVSTDTSIIIENLNNITIKPYTSPRKGDVTISPYISPTNGFSPDCLITINLTMINLISIINPNDILCINYEGECYLAPSLVDLMNVQTKGGTGEVKLLTDWTKFEEKNGNKYALSSSLGYELYLDISTLNASCRQFDSSLKYHDSSIKELKDTLDGIGTTIGGLGSKGDTKANPVNYAKYLSNEPDLWGQNFDGYSNVTGGLKEASYVALDTNTSPISTNAPWFGVGQDSNKLTLASKQGIDLYTDDTNTHYVNINAGTSKPGRLKIGNAVLTYDSTNKALQLYGADGTGISMYATGNIAAYGATTNAGMDYLNVNKSVNVGNTIINGSIGETSTINSKFVVEGETTFKQKTTFKEETTFEKAVKMNSSLEINQNVKLTGTDTKIEAPTFKGNIDTNLLSINGTNLTGISLTTGILTLTINGETIRLSVMP